MPVIDDPGVVDASKVRRIVLCSGKVFYDLEAARAESRDERVAVVRLEQFYPFPKSALEAIIAKFPNATQLFWTQEEPKNMGGWTFVEPRLRAIKRDGMEVRFVGRAASASPATGSYAIHELEQRKLVDESLLAETDEIAPSSEPEVSEKIAPASA